MLAVTSVVESLGLLQMSLLKRFELWVLLIFIGGGLFYIFNMQGIDNKNERAPITAPSPDVSDKSEPSPRFSLQKTTISRDGDHFLAEIMLNCRNDHKQALALVSPGTRLMAAGGQEIPAFFLPFQAPPEIPASTEKNVTLRYWLNHEQINGPVSLKIDTETVSIKTGGFEIDILPDKQSRSFTGTDWSPKA